MFSRLGNVFITGSTSGINLGIAHVFAKLGCNVGICGRTADTLSIAKKDLESHGTTISAHQVDVRDHDQLEKALHISREEIGPISTVIAGAAGNFFAPANSMKPNGFKAVIDIDLVGSFNTAQVAFPHLAETKGNIIFISAGQGLIPYPMQVHAGAAKAGIENMMKNLAWEWGSHGVRSNSIVPGPIEDTEGLKRLGPQTEGDHEKFKQLIPLQRYGKSEEIGRVAVFLSSPWADYITGSTVMVDGGMNLPGSGGLAMLLNSSK